MNECTQTTLDVQSQHSDNLFKGLLRKINRVNYAARVLEKCLSESLEARVIRRRGPRAVCGDASCLSQRAPERRRCVASTVCWGVGRGGGTRTRFSCRGLLRPWPFDGSLQHQIGRLALFFSLMFSPFLGYVILTFSRLTLASLSISL